MFLYFFGLKILQWQTQKYFYRTFIIINLLKDKPEAYYSFGYSFVSDVVKL